MVDHPLSPGEILALCLQFVLPEFSICGCVGGTRSEQWLECECSTCLQCMAILTDGPNWTKWTLGAMYCFPPPAILKQENIFWICLLSNEFTPSFWIDSRSCLVFSQPFFATPSGRVTECRFLAFPHWQPGSCAHFSILLLGSSYQRANSALIDIIECWFSRKCSKFLSGANVIFKEHWWSLKKKTNLVKDTEKSFYFQCSTFWFCFFFPLRLPEAQSVFFGLFCFF